MSKITMSERTFDEVMYFAEVAQDGGSEGGLGFFEACCKAKGRKRMTIDLTAMSLPALRRMYEDLSYYGPDGGWEEEEHARWRIRPFTRLRDEVRAYIRSL